MIGDVELRKKMCLAAVEKGRDLAEIIEDACREWLKKNSVLPPKEKPKLVISNEPLEY